MLKNVLRIWLVKQVAYPFGVHYKSYNNYNREILNSKIKIDKDINYF